MEQLQVFEQNGELYTDSREVAQMIEIYISVIQKMAIKYGTSFEEVSDNA